MPRNMRIEVDESLLIIRFAGELDALSSKQYREKIGETLERLTPPQVIMDFSEITFIDSSGIGLILGRFNQLKEWGGKLIISGLNAYSATLFRVSGLSRLIPFSETIDSARKELLVK